MLREKKMDSFSDDLCVRPRWRFVTKRKLDEYNYRHESYSHAVLHDRGHVVVLRKM